MTTASQAKSNKANKPLVEKVMEKKTQCALYLVLTVQIPTKKQKHQAKTKPYNLYTPMYLNLHILTTTHLSQHMQLVFNTYQKKQITVKTEI